MNDLDAKLERLHSEILDEISQLLYSHAAHVGNMLYGGKADDSPVLRIYKGYLSTMPAHRQVAAVLTLATVLHQRQNGIGPIDADLLRSRLNEVRLARLRAISNVQKTA